MTYLTKPITPTQKYLAKIVGTYNESLPTPITTEEKYLYYIAVNGSGGGESTTNYNLLNNKPEINGVSLIGNKSTADLGIVIPDVSDFITYTEVEDILENYVTGTVFDSTIAGFYTKSQVDSSLSGKVDKVSGMGLSTNDYSTAEKNKLANLSNYDDTELRSKLDEVGYYHSNSNVASYTFSLKRTDASNYYSFLLFYKHNPDEGAGEALYLGFVPAAESGDVQLTKLFGSSTRELSATFNDVNQVTLNASSAIYGGITIIG